MRLNLLKSAVLALGIGLGASSCIMKRSTSFGERVQGDTYGEQVENVCKKAEDDKENSFSRFETAKSEYQTDSIAYAHRFPTVEEKKKLAERKAKMEQCLEDYKAKASFAAAIEAYKNGLDSATVNTPGLNVTTSDIECSAVLNHLQEISSSVPSQVYN